MKCKFDLGWSGKCKSDAIKGKEYCEEHLEVKCKSCGIQATHLCGETGQFVCGAPLCDDCTHNVSPRGDNGGIGFGYPKLPDDWKEHCKKSDQKYAPWYVKPKFLDLWKKENNIPEDVEVILTYRD